MDQRKFACLAASIVGILAAQSAAAMDVSVVKDKDGKEYFCANAKCAGNSDCAGAGNAACANQNKCANSEQKFLSGWIGADNKEMCEKEGKGKWLAYKKEFSFKGPNKAPLVTQDAKAGKKK